ncbi:MAG: HNH endonuclease signature motif containing protein [Verrucomicrobiales bacterium]|nr:HNH endonuclease signature motif containing protein [Verrucomicrobiales bacterium]
MALKISAALKKSIQDELGIKRAEVEDRVWAIKDHHCFLCSSELNRATDNIELDHNIPVAEGGYDLLENLNLTHSECNRYKRNHSSIDVRPHLRFKCFWETQNGAVNFKETLNFYKLNSSKIYVTEETPTSITIETSLGKSTVPIFQETVGENCQSFCFFEFPISAVENDDEIQPRNIKLNHLLAIASDLKKNPLHEQPACRIVGTGNKKRALMFDGQHKTVANLINGNKSLVFKLYLTIETTEAIELVNSIQSRIKKLPLTPFELATKMSDEFRRKLEIYEADIGSVQVSEQGFINWLDPAERTRAKKGIEAAVIDRIISDESLDFGRLIDRPGIVNTEAISIKEASFQKNVLKILLYTKPLPESYTGEAMKLARERESRNVIKLLNLIYDRGFAIQDDKDQEREIERISRLRYQASLLYMCKVFRQLASNLVMPLHDENTFFEREINAKNWKKMAGYIDLFFSHPIWICDLSGGKKTREVEDALSKNQNVENAFRDILLTPGYCGGLDKLPTNWQS